MSKRKIRRNTQNHTLERELKSLLDQFPGIDYPILSRDDLVKKVGGPNRQFSYSGKTYTANEAIALLADEDFPLKSEEAAARLIIDQIRTRQEYQQKDNTIVMQLIPKLSFPIDDKDEFQKQLIAHGMNPNEATTVVRSIPAFYFPIANMKDCTGKFKHFFPQKPTNMERVTVVARKRIPEKLTCTKLEACIKYETCTKRETCNHPCQFTCQTTCQSFCQTECQTSCQGFWE